MYTDRETVDLGLTLPSWVRRTGREMIGAGRDVLLYRGGELIAETPQGQYAIRQEVQRRLLERAKEVAPKAAAIGLPIILGLGALFLLSRRGR